MVLPITISAIALSCYNVQHSRSKHIDIRFHFIKEHVENGVIELYFVNMEYQLAGHLHKALQGEELKCLTNKLGMRSAPVMRTASAAAKPCQGDSSEFYLITGSGEVMEYQLDIMWRYLVKGLRVISIDAFFGVGSGGETLVEVMDGGLQVTIG
ncbi:hypothetical protein Tco_1361217 [Tanacetum coccineum]